MRKHLLSILVKYGLGLGLLTWVVWSHWHPKYGFRPEHLVVLLEQPAAGFPASTPWAALYLSGQEEWTGPENPGISGALRRPVRWGFLFLTVTIGLISLLITFIRWHILVRAQDLPFEVGDALRLGLIGLYFNTFLPGSVGGDIIKAAFIAREQSRRTIAVATVIIDRVVGFCGLLWLVALIGTVIWRTGLLDSPVFSDQARLTLRTILVGGCFLTAASLAFWLFLGVLSEQRTESLADRLSRFPKVGHSLAELLHAVSMYRRKGGHVGVSMLLAMIGHFGFVATFYCAANTLSRPENTPDLATHYLLVPVGMTIQAGFPAPGGVGGGEYGFGALYQIVGYSFAAGVLGSLVQRMIFGVVGLAGYLVYFRMKPRLPPVVG